MSPAEFANGASGAVCPGRDINSNAVAIKHMYNETEKKFFKHQQIMERIGMNVRLFDVERFEDFMDSLTWFKGLCCSVDPGSQNTRG